MHKFTGVETHSFKHLKKQIKNMYVMEKIDAIRTDLLSDYDFIRLTKTNLPHAQVNHLTLSEFHEII